MNCTSVGRSVNNHSSSARRILSFFGSGSADFRFVRVVGATRVFNIHRAAGLFSQRYATERFLRPAYSGVTQLRVAPVRLGRVPRGASKYCSCLARWSSAQLRGALSGASDPADTMSSGRVQSGVGKRCRGARFRGAAETHVLGCCFGGF